MLTFTKSDINIYLYNKGITMTNPIMKSIYTICAYKHERFVLLEGYGG